MFLNDNEFAIEQEKAREFFNDLMENHDFNKVVTTEKSYWSWECDHRNYLSSKGFYSYEGACRAVLVEEGANYVYKFDLYRRDDEIHYTANEEQAYLAACEAGIEDAFCPIRKILTLHATNEGIDFGMDIFILPFCHVEHEISDACYSNYFKVMCDDLGYDYDNLSEEEEEEVRDNISSEYNDTQGVLEYVSTIWTDAFFAAVVNFLEKYHINDLHSGNWGYYGDKLVMTDYAGYGRDIGENYEED